SAIFSLAISLPTKRLKGQYFVMLSLAIQALLFGVAKNWFSPGAEPGTWSNLTNGSIGLVGLPKAFLFGWQLNGTAEMAALATIVTALGIFIFYLLIHSPWRRLMQAIRDDEVAAA